MNHVDLAFGSSATLNSEQPRSWSIVEGIAGQKRQRGAPRVPMPWIDFPLNRTALVNSKCLESLQIGRLIRHETRELATASRFSEATKASSLILGLGVRNRGPKPLCLPQVRRISCWVCSGSATVLSTPTLSRRRGSACERCGRWAGAEMVKLLPHFCRHRCGLLLFPGLKVARCQIWYSSLAICIGLYSLDKAWNPRHTYFGATHTVPNFPHTILIIFIVVCAARSPSNLQRIQTHHCSRYSKSNGKGISGIS